MAPMGAGGKEMLDLPPMIPGAPELTRLERVGQLGKGAFGKVIEVPRERGENSRQRRANKSKNNEKCKSHDSKIAGVTKRGMPQPRRKR